MDTEACIEAVMAALTQGRVAYEGGEDHRGHETVGGDHELRASGGCFVLTERNWSTAFGRSERSQSYSEPELRAALRGEPELRSWVASALQIH